MKIRPSKTLSLIAMIIGLTMFIGGIIYAIPNLGIYGIFWTVGTGLTTLYYAINLFSKKGISLFTINKK